MSTLSLSHGATPADRYRQSGAALVMALVILLVLTLLGISAMRTSSLEQLMAGNVQEMMRAFEAADSGTEKALVDIATFNGMTSPMTASYNVTGSNDVLKSTATIYPPIPLQIADCPRSGNPSGQSQKCANYEQIIIGATTNTGAQSVRDQGVRKSAPNNGPGSGVTVTTN